MLNEKLDQLQRAARRHSEPLAIWVVYAVHRYFHNGATALFQRRDGIIKSISKLIS